MWRSPKASSLRTRPRWKSASPLTTPATTSASQIELLTRNTSSSAGPSAPRPKATVADAPRSRKARATSEPGTSSTGEAATSRSHAPKPSAGKSRATPSSGRAARRIGAPLTPRCNAHTPVPFVRELAQSWPADAPRIAGVQEHLPRAAPCERGGGGAQRVLRAGGERGDACARAAVVLVPVAMPAAPHLVDAALGDLRTELRLVMDDGRTGEVVHLPAGAAEPELQVDLLGVEEEPLVEEAYLLQGLAAEYDGRTHDPVDRARLFADRLLDAELADGEQPEGADRGRRKAPSRRLQAPF